MKPLYSDTLSAIRMVGMSSDGFRVDRGVRQGCRMAPDLFLRPMDKILEDTVTQRHLGVNIGKERFTDLDYADGVALQAESCGNVVDSLETMGQEASNFGLEINWSKTKIQSIGVQGAIPDHVLVAELVHVFCYLGCHV